MNAAHFHLLVNHIPIVGFVMALPLFVLAFIRKFDQGIVLSALIVVLISCAGSAAAYFSGEATEVLVERIPGVSLAQLHEHEEAAEIANLFSIFTGLAAAALLGIITFNKEKLKKPFFYLVIVLTLATIGTMIFTGRSGGLIRHPEIQKDWSPPSAG